MDQFDKQEIYCRKLGHHLNFSYCRKENLGAPCSGIVSCWQQSIDVARYLGNHYPDFIDNQENSVPKAKISSILDIVNQLKSQHSVS